MIKLKSLIKENFQDPNSIWYHGSASGNLKGGATGLHLGTFQAAKEALEATIGIPVEGEWDGTREYGKTLLCGKNTLKHRNIHPTGFNAGTGTVKLPENDFYPEEWEYKAFFSNKDKVQPNMKPAIKKYKLLCSMTNSPHRAYNDWKANGYMSASIKKGNAKRGFYYINMSEDEGSISVVVPNGSCVKEV